jgi:deazaflavin-dependent oxidoreductase (nitroreductase family)
MPIAPRPLAHVDPEAARGAHLRAAIRVLGTRPMLWFERTPIWRILWWRLVPRLWRLTGGRLGGDAPLPTGLLETTDTRNGRPHRRVLFYFHDRDRVTLIATKGGLPQDPHWYENALASPHVRFAGEPFRAERVDAGAERDRLWALADRCFPPFAAYRALAARTGREIPILQLTPR